MITMPRDKVLILLDEGNLVHCPSAYIEVYYPQFYGGIPARDGGYHVYPTMRWPKRPDSTRMLFGENVESLKKKIEAFYPEEKYRKEYV